MLCKIWLIFMIESELSVNSTPVQDMNENHS